MERLVITIGLVLVLLTGAANALTPLGSPLPQFGPGDRAMGVEYAFGEMTGTGSIDGLTAEGKIDTSLLCAKYCTGINDKLELVVRAGMAELEPEGIGADYGVAAGFGLKYKLPPVRGLDCGFIAQTTWMRSQMDALSGWNTDIQVNELQLAVGVEHRVNDKVKVFGGPLFQIVSGSGELSQGKTSYDIDISTETDFGGYIGASWQINPAVDLVTEFQLVGDGHTIVGGFLWRF